MNGVISFVRGIDLSRTDFKEEGSFPREISGFRNLRWLKLDRTGLEVVPSVLTRLTHLEHLSVEGNRLFHVPPSVGMLHSLQVFRAPNNQLTEDDLPRGLFTLKDLTTLDLHNNKLKALPGEVDRAAGLIVLDVSANELDSDAADFPLPSGFFVACTELRHLNLSKNQLKRLPPQIVAATHLQTLILSSNPLGNCSLRNVLQLTALDTLDLADTGRTADGLPDELGTALTSLRSLNLAQNKLDRFPSAVAALPALVRLDLGSNAITTLPDRMSGCHLLQVLVISRNRIAVLPKGFVRAVPELRRLYANRNELTSIPADIGRLCQLEQLQLSKNRISTVPAELMTGCHKLEKLVLSNNNLTSVPESIHSCPNLDLQTDGNPNFNLPPKPQPSEPKGAEAYFADFARIAPSLDGPKRSMREVLGLPTTPVRVHSPLKKMNRGDDAQGKAILDGLVQIADLSKAGGDEPADREARLAEAIGDVSLPGATAPVEGAGRWSGDFLSRDDVDYSVVFGKDVGNVAGLTCWRIENFAPVPYTLRSNGGALTSADCFIILSTVALSGADDLSQVIFYWIGQCATLDKKSSAAMNALSLRGYLKSRQSTRREEQGDESSDFLDLFGGSIEVVDGGTDTGFYHAEEEEHITRLYALISGKESTRNNATESSTEGHLVPRCDVHLNAVATPIVPSALTQTERVLLFDTATAVYLWRGSSTSQIQFQRARLFAEKFLRAPRGNSRRDRKPLVEVGQHEAEANVPFSKAFNDAVLRAKEEHGDMSQVEWVGGGCKIFEVRLGKGVLELPQVARGRGGRRRLGKDCLKSTGAYIVDSGADIYVWFGRRSSRILQAAATRLVDEVERMAPRPPHLMVSYQSEGLESAIFKSNFFRWDDVLSVDHRSPELRALDNARQLGTCPFGLDVSELYSSPREVISNAAATELEEQWKADLDKVDTYVLQGSNFVRLPKAEVGKFYSENCYVFLCKEWHVVKTAGDEEDPALVASPNPVSPDGDGDADEDVNEELEVTAYFWQGRDAGPMPWLVFSFSVLPGIRKMISTKLECNLRVVKETQLQESMRFMALFDRKMVIVQGHRQDALSTTAPELFHVHSWRPLVFTRTVQVQCSATELHESGCFVLRVPFGPSSGAIYIWRGDNADPAAVAAAVALPTGSMWPGHSVQILSPEDELPQVFCTALGVEVVKSKIASQPKSCLIPSCRRRERHGSYDGDTLTIDPTHPGVGTTRVFRCAFKEFVFAIRECVPQASQDDLREAEAAIIKARNSDVWLWTGPLVSDVVRRLAAAAADELAKRDGHGCKVIPVRMGAEPLTFTRLFHGWSRCIQRSIELARPIPYLKHILDPLPPRPPLHKRHGTRSPFYLHYRKDAPEHGDDCGSTLDTSDSDAGVPAVIMREKFTPLSPVAHARRQSLRMTPVDDSPRHSPPVSSRKDRLKTYSADRSSIGPLLFDEDSTKSPGSWI